jgi:hypothetical protein
VAVGLGCLLPPLSSGGARRLLRFHIPLIEPDVQIARIRLSDRTSRRRLRLITSKCREAYETEVHVELRVRMASATTSPCLMLVPATIGVTAKRCKCRSPDTLC